jgi:hypothetical protein
MKPGTDDHAPLMLPARLRVGSNRLRHALSRSLLSTALAPDCLAVSEADFRHRGSAARRNMKDREGALSAPEHFHSEWKCSCSYFASDFISLRSLRGSSQGDIALCQNRLLRKCQLVA